MREILFCGKRTDNGQWAEGFLVKHPSAVQIGDCSPWYISVPPKDPEDNGGLWNVTAETVGQFTGLTDKNGKKIFEGDIVRYMNKETMVVVWNNDSASFAIAYSAINFNYIATILSAHIYLEVIGNIHDNPELLEVTDNAE